MFEESELDNLYWEDDERRSANEFLHSSVEYYKNFLNSKADPDKLDEIAMTLSSLLNTVIYPNCIRNRGRMTFLPISEPGRTFGCAFAIHAGPRRGRCQNRLYRGVRLYCNKEIHKKGRCRYHLRKFRQKHYL